MLPSPHPRGLGLRIIFCRGHFWVHSRYGPVTRSPSQGWLCQLASSASFPPRMRPKLRRFLTFPPVRLTLTEHVCLVWTHWGRVEKKRGSVQNRRRLRRAASFVAALAEKSIAPSLLPAHRTGRADFPHPALGRVSRQGMRAADRTRRGQHSGDRTPSVPNTACMGNCR